MIAVTNLITNRIIQLNLFLWGLGAYLFNRTGDIRYLFLVFYVFILNEVIYFFTGLDLYYSHYRTELCYSSASMGQINSEESLNVNSNLTEGIFHDERCVDWREAEKNRFDEFIKLLNIQPGEAVLDAGCGHGGLVMYLRSKGINAEGITITKTQYVNNTKNHGPYFHHGDYTEFQPQFVNKFDHIILPGSLEHPFGGNPRLISTYEYKCKKMTEMFNMFKKYFKPHSDKKHILATCIHGNRKFKDTPQAFFTERMFGGAYPLIDEYSVADALEAANYNVTMNKDYTWHYYYASYCDNTHFGNPVDIGSLLTFIAFPLYPHVLYANWYWNNGYWMWMWSGKNHYRRQTKVCQPDKGCDLVFEKDPQKRPGTLYYTVAKLD